MSYRSVTIPLEEYESLRMNKLKHGKPYNKKLFRLIKSYIDKTTGYHVGTAERCEFVKSENELTSFMDSDYYDFINEETKWKNK